MNGLLTGLLARRETGLIEEIENSDAEMTELRARLAEYEKAAREPVAVTERELRAQGIYFAANRFLEAWEHGFIEEPAADVLDVATMILDAATMIDDAPEGNFKRDFADQIVAVLKREIAAKKDSAPHPVVPVPQCSCPSGGGSLRWPCPVHPPEKMPDDEDLQFEIEYMEKAEASGEDATEYLQLLRWLKELQRRRSAMLAKQGMWIAGDDMQLAQYTADKKLITEYKKGILNNLPKKKY